MAQISSRVMDRGATAAPRKVSLAQFSEFWRLLPDLALASTTINLLAMVLPLALLQVYDRIIPNQSHATLGVLVLALVLVLVLELLVKIGRNHITSWLAAQFEHKVACSGLRRLLDANIVDIEAGSASGYLERFRSITALREFYGGDSLLALFDLPFTMVYLALIWMIADWLVLVPIVMLALFLGFAILNGRKVREDIQRRNMLDGQRFSFLAEVIQGIHSVKTMAMEALMLRRYEMLQESNVDQSFKSTMDSVAASDLGSQFSQLTMLLMVVFGAGQVISAESSPGTLAACVMLASRSLQPLRSAIGVWTRFQAISVARRQVQGLFDLSVEHRSQLPDLPPIRGALTIESATVRHAKASRPVFDCLSFSVGAGACIGIVGASGCGKSSLLGLLAGMVHPEQGRVLVDGHDLGAFNSASLSRQIAYLPQQGVLFKGTLLDNITMLDSTLEGAALEVAKLLGLDQVVAGMRNGYDTWIDGSVSDAMPGGIRQRIAIARALVHRPKVVLFDESNIAIDAAGDDMLRIYLERLRGHSTLILVTHRPSLLKLADQVYTITDGRLQPYDQGGVGAGAQGPRAQVPAAIPPRPVQMTGVGDSLKGRFPQASDLSRCLIALLHALEWRGNPRQLAESLPHMAESLDITGFRRVMTNLNYHGDSFRTTLGAIRTARLPVLFVPDRGPALVLLAESDGGLLVYNGATGNREVVAADATRGTSFRFDERDRVGTGSGVVQGSWLLTVLVRFQPLIWLNLLITLCVTVLGLATPALLMIVYNSVIPAGNTGILPFLAVGAGIALAMESVLRILRKQVFAHMGARCEFLIGGAIFQRLMALPATAAESATVGSQLARIKDFDILRELFVGRLSMFLYEMPMTAVYVVALTLINPWIIMTMLVCFFACVVLGLMTQAGLTRRMAISSKDQTRRQEFLTECLGKIRTIKFSGAEYIWYQRYRALSARAMESELVSQQFTTRMSCVSQMLGSLTAVAALTTCVLASFSGAIGPGAVVVSMILTWRLTGPLQSSFHSVSMLMRVIRSGRQIDNLMRLRVERDPASPRHAPPPLKGEVTLQRVSFRYSNDADPVLLGVTLKVLPHQVAAIAGPNGAGKSTVIKLITGIYQPQAGSIRIDNIDIRQFDPWDLRAVIAYVPQNCDMFYGTIAQNLRLTHPNASDDELRWGVEMAGLTEDILALPRGFDTRISDGQASQLPHGFRQRLSLARAYIKPAPVMLFDEPGNGLDNAGDMAFQRAIEWLRQQSTIFIVSHRPSHLRMADVVMYLQDGYVRDVGSFDKLSGLIMSALK